MLVFVLSQSEDQYGSFKNMFEDSGDEVIHIRHGVMGQQGNDPGLIVEAYEFISLKIDAVARVAGGPRSLRGALALADITDPYFNTFERLTPIAVTFPNWPSVIAMLVLAYPEIHWVFTNEDIETPTSLFRSAHIYAAADPEPLFDVRGANFTPLFDPTGLRNLIRKNIRQPSDPGQARWSHVPLRDSVAAVIDDETSYAHFVAHTAYRFGYRCHLVTTFKMLSDLFGKNAPRPDAQITFEDISLNFPDKPESVRLAELPKRDNLLPGLGLLKHRVFVTYGYTKKSALNEKWLDYLREKGVVSSLILKPISGMFDLSLRFAASQDFTSGIIPHEEPEEGHGVPGRLMLIAGRLILRATALLRDKESVEDCIQGAVLAGDAFELLGNRVPTSAIEAVTLRHELEVSAECMFPGLQTALDVKNRIASIEREACYLSTRFHWETRRISKLDTELGVLNRVTTLIRENDRFDEEQECLKRVRRLRRGLWLTQKRGRWAKLLSAPEYVVRWYVDALLNNFKAFALALMSWVGLATIVFRSVPGKETPPGWEWPMSFYHAVENFVSAHPPDEVHSIASLHSPWFLWFVPMLVIFGFVHLGIFVAYLYSTIVRKSS